MKGNFCFFFYQDFVPVTEQPVAKNFSINNMVMEERMRQAGQQPPPWHEQDEVDSTRVSKTSFCAVGKNDQYLSSVIRVIQKSSNFFWFLTLILYCDFKHIVPENNGL